MGDCKILISRLSELLQSPLASIEILPGGLDEWQSIALPADAPKLGPDFPFVLVEGNLGIPKKILYAIYMAAVAMPWRSSGPQAADSVSSIILLVNPAHQTALNTRKRLIEDRYLDPQKELSMIEVMCRGSPECAKQSIIWAHRRWSFTRLFGIMGPNVIAPSPQNWASSEEIQSFPRLNPCSIQDELRLIQHTCETYPRNYHSWAHWHFVVNVCYASIYLSEDDAVRRHFLGIIVEEYARLRTWVELHVSDYSAMHQLCQTQKLFGRLVLDGMVADDLMKRSITPALVDHSLSLLIAFPSHESLWMYLRDSLSTLSFDDDRINVLKRLSLQTRLHDDKAFSRRVTAWFSNRRDLDIFRNLHIPQGAIGLDER